MSSPSDLFYTKDHEWIRFTAADEAEIGITAYALDQLGDVVFLDLPNVEANFKHGDSFGTVESTKTVSDLYCPISGTVLAVNSKLSDKPESIVSDPYKSGWLIKIKFSQKDAPLLTSSQYDSYTSEHA